MGYYRSVSPGERAFHLAKETGPSRKFLQVIFEGEGELSLRQWQAAVAAASVRHESARLVLRGHLGFSRWDSSGPPPNVTEVFAEWDGFDFDRAPFLWPAPVDLRKGPLSEVVLIQGTTPRILLRVHHAIMDGVGAMIFAQDVFRILRGEETVGTNSTRTELDVWRAADFGSGKMPAAPPNAIVPFPPGDGDPDAPFVWKRMSLPGRISRIIPKVAVGLAEQSRSIRDGTVRIGLFVNLRHHLEKGEITLANCTSMIVFEVAPDDTVRTVMKKITESMRKRTYLDMSRYVGLARWVPAAVFKAAPRAVRRLYRTGLFRTSAFVTHVGTFTPEPYSYREFRATGVIPLSPFDPTTPLNVVICEGPDSVEIVANAPAALAGNGRLDHLIAGLQKTLLDSQAAMA
jgi:hypothetical protein